MTNCIIDRLRDVDSVAVENGLFSLTTGRPVAVNTETHDCTAHDKLVFTGCGSCQLRFG